MTVAATSPAPAGTEERLQNRALDLLKAQTLAVILESDEPTRTADVARGVADRLGLKLNEEEMGGLASVVRLVMDSDPLFSQSNRQWDLALRMGRAEGDRRKPVERAIEDFIDLLSEPSPAAPVAALVAAVYGRPADYYEKMIDRLADTRPQFFRVDRERLGITRWLLELSSDDPEDVEQDNFAGPEALDGLREVAQGLKKKDPAEFARTLLEKAGRPIENKALQFFTWCALPDTDLEELFKELANDDDLYLERGANWTTAAERERVLGAIRALARAPQEATEVLAAAAPEEEEIGILAPTTVRVSDEDLDQVSEYMGREERSYRVTELLQQVLEAFPGSRTYGGVLESLTNRMREDSRFAWAGWDRYRLAGTIPGDIQVLPEGLAFDEREYLGPEGVEIDKVVDFRDWKANLEHQIQHYLVQDIGDDSTSSSGQTVTRLTTSVPLHHYIPGTLYLRNSDRGFFPATPEIVQTTLVADSQRYDVWVNNRLGLVYGLKDWYEANLPWVGGRFTIERAEPADEYRLVRNPDEVEPLMDISDRLPALLQLRAEALEEGLPLLEVVLRIMKSAPDGLHFVTLFTAVNVVRRIRRAQLASTLSSQRYFQAGPQGSDTWHYDEKRAAKATKKKGGPKRPMREIYDEDDEEFEE